MGLIWDRSGMATKKGIVKNKTTGIDIKFNPLPEFALEIINAGGLLEHIKKVKS